MEAATETSLGSLEAQPPAEAKRSARSFEAQMESMVDTLVRPYLRGRLHQVATLGSLGGLVWIVHVAPTPRARAAAWVYALAAVLLYATSSAYHTFARSPRTRRVMQRLDHSMIYVLIAGTFTPIAVLTIGDPWRWPALAAMWAGALGGVALKLFGYPRFKRFGAALYLVLGWAAMAALPALVHRPGVLGFVVAGGLLYTVGAVLFALRWPSLSPRWFGYHELWHAVGVAAGVMLFIANLGLVRAG